MLKISASARNASLSILAVFACLSINAPAQQDKATVALVYDSQTRGPVPIPRDDGHNLESTSMAIKPETNDLYIVTTDAEDGQGATIFHAKTFATALPLYSHQ